MELTCEESCRQVEELKAKGNEAFAREEYETALEIYGKAIASARNSNSANPGEIRFPR